MSYRRALARGATIGLLFGIVVAVCLLALGQFGVGEPMEAVMLFAVPLSFPVGVVILAAGWGEYASQWIGFIAVALPGNMAFWGALVGLIRAANAGKEHDRQSNGR